MQNELRDDASITNGRENSKGRIAKESNGEPRPQSAQSDVSSSVMEGGDSKALVLSKSVLPSTGYDLSCVCVRVQLERKTCLLLQLITL